MEIKINHVTKILDSNKVLDDICLNMSHGKIYGLMGRNGSGKSMLLKAICGFIKPTEGNIIVDNIDLSKTNAFPASASALIDRPCYLPDLNAFDNLKLVASIKNEIKDEQIREFLKLVGLNDDKKVFKKFSLGMKQKLGIAQALMENPKIIILDEPFNGVDDITSKRLRDYLKKIKKDKIIIIASHIKEDLYDLCEEIFEIENGKIKKEK